MGTSKAFRFVTCFETVVVVALNELIELVLLLSSAAVWDIFALM